MTRKHPKSSPIISPSKTTHRPFLRGIYKDCLTDPQGKHIWESGWRNNRVVQRCHLLLAALMKREPGFSGILYWAVGEGAASWDRLIPSPNGDEQQLANEVSRKTLAAGDIRYLDERHNVVETPTARLQISATFAREELGGEGVQVLREFGLFGGDATGTLDSGWMIDYIIHPGIPLSAGMTLTRNLHLSFGSGTDLGESMGGFGGALPVISIDGIGEEFSGLLNRTGINTLSNLVAIDPLQSIENIPGVKLREFRAKARMVLNLNADLLAFVPLSERNISDLLKADPQTLAGEVGSPLVTDSHIIQMQEQLAILQVALDDTTLREISLGDLLNT